MKNERGLLLGSIFAEYKNIKGSISSLQSNVTNNKARIAKLNGSDPDFPEQAMRLGSSQWEICEVRLPELRSKKQAIEAKIFESLTDSEKTIASRISELAAKNYLLKEHYEAILLYFGRNHVQFKIFDDKGEGKQPDQPPSALPDPEPARPDPKPEQKVIFERKEKIGVSDGGKEKPDRSFKLIDVAKELGWKVYPKSGITPDGALIRMIALELGIEEANHRCCRFNLEEVERIKASLATEKTSTEKTPRKRLKTTEKLPRAGKIIVFMGKEINFDLNAIAVIKTLKILEKHSKNNPISAADLAREVSDDGVPLSVAKNRLGFQIHSLKLRLKDYGFEIGSKKDVSQDKPGRRRALYYVIDNNPKKEQEKNKEPLTDGEMFILTKRLLWLRLRKGFLLTNSGIDAQVLEKEEDISILMRGVQSKLDSEKINTSSFERRAIESLIPKLRYFADNKTDYMVSCSRPGQILLRCFNGAKMDDEFLKKVFPAENIIYAPKASQNLRVIGTT